MPDYTKEFEVRLTAREKGPTFKLGNETIRTVPAVPVGLIFDLPNGKVTNAQVHAFVRGCIDPDDMDAFDRALRSNVHVVDWDQLAGIYDWLMSEAYDRPFVETPPAPSSNGPGTISATSTAEPSATTSPFPTSP